MHLIGWQAPGVPATPSPPRWRGKPLAVYLCTRPSKLIPSIHEQHPWICTACTATLALQLELEEVGVVRANSVIAAEPAIQHAYTPNDLLVLEIIDEVFPAIGFTLSQTES